MKESLKQVIEDLKAKGEDVQELNEICRGLERQEQDTDTSLGKKSKKQQDDAETGRPKEQVEGLKIGKINFEEQLAKEKAALGRARQEFKDKLA